MSVQKSVVACQVRDDNDSSDGRKSINTRHQLSTAEVLDSVTACWRVLTHFLDILNLPPSHDPTSFARAKQVRIHVRCFSTKFDIYSNSTTPADKQRFVQASGTYPKGFRVGSINVGMKPTSKSQPDLVLVASETPSCGAAVFTKNEFPAASVTVSKDVMQRTKGYGLRGVIANSGCGNTLTGKAGLEDAAAMIMEADKYVSGERDASRDTSVMVMHTGVGAQRLPINDILPKISKLYQGMGNSHAHWLEAARGLCTTDTFPKLASRKFTLHSSPDTTFSIAGITKGAGMVHPNMATTLGIICTDAPVTPEALQQLLSVAADKSYNCISIDGDTSTNDMVVMFANGAAAANSTSQTAIDFCPSAAPSELSADFVTFQRVLIEFMADMAKLVVRDGEGASKFIEIRVRGSPSYEAAKHIASVIARSVLVKAGIYGRDPNWGGILAALGYSLLDTQFAGQGIIVPELTSVSFVDGESGDSLKFLDKGAPAKVDEENIRRVMAREDVEVVVDLRDGSEGGVEESVYWTCDLTHEFVTINSDFGN